MWHQQLSTYQVLLDHKADINAKNNDGRTALSLAAVDTPHGAALVRLLLLHGADASIKDNTGKTALDHAREVDMWDNSKVIRLLDEAAKKEQRRKGGQH
jgi:hypothetical protein